MLARVSRLFLSSSFPLDQTNGNLDHAVELLLLIPGAQGDGPASYAAAPPEPAAVTGPARGAAPGSGFHPHQWSVRTLVDIGFGRDQAIAALKATYGDVKAARLLLPSRSKTVRLPKSVAVPMGGSNYSVGILGKRPASVRPADDPELRIDASDGNPYDLDSFIDVYGGSRIAPPHEWFSADQVPVPASPNDASDAPALTVNRSKKPRCVSARCPRPISALAVDFAHKGDRDH